MCAGPAAQGGQVGELAVEVHRQHRVDPADVRGVEVLGGDAAVLAHVDEHGDGAEGEHRVGGGGEGEGGYGDPAARADAHRGEGELEGGGAAGDRDGVACAAEGGELDLEGGDLGATGQLATLEHPGDGGALLEPDLRGGDGQERRRGGGVRHVHPLCPALHLRIDRSGRDLSRRGAVGDV